MNNTCNHNHNWKFFDEYIYLLDDENEAALCPIYKCTKCGKVIKSEDLSEKDYKKLCLTGETIKL